MTEVILRGVPIVFPFEPYEIQKEYMEKVLECLQEGANGVLESPTGTGKTLSLLCSTLAWLQLKKAQVQAQRQVAGNTDDMLLELNKHLQDVNGKQINPKALTGLPTVIYTSRTHSQLSQAMQEMKRTAYRHMNAVILGSRDQLCIHPEIEKEENRSFQIMMCRLKVKTRSCKFHNKLDTFKNSPQVLDCNIMDIEDLVKLGKGCGFCPFYMAKELKDRADIVFMPYNYLLDPATRKALNINLLNAVVIVDEAHNVERMCEESASLQIKSSDVALAIEEVTAIMKMISQETISYDDTPKDFDADDLCNLKEVFLNLEKAIDGIDLRNKSDGLTLEGTYIFDLLERGGIRGDNYSGILRLIFCVVQYLATVNDGPFARRGNNLQVFEDIFRIIFSNASHDFRQKVKRCYKVYIREEEVQKKRSDWLSKVTTSRKGGKIINFWCFSPGFGMDMLMREQIRTLILTSGTLAPLKPLISELEINVTVRLENPHIIGNDQICVKILPAGPDSEQLNSSFQNRDNPKYINSLGMSILNITRVVPDGMLIFFPSYPIMLNCQKHWQQSGIWGSICNIKAIYVEPRDKDSFNTAMTEYYKKIQDLQFKGAIFMGVCRGKVSEGLDFVDANGRAVIITGLPYPPFKDPKIMLKKEYLDRCHVQDKEYLKGQEWYNLEASRAVNQAIGRVIRHKDDYGAILLLDARFNSSVLRNQLSLWIRDHIKVAKNFGEVIMDLRKFFNGAEAKFKSILPPLQNAGPSKYSATTKPESSNTVSNLNSTGEVVIHQRNRQEFANPPKKIKLTLVPNSSKGSSVPKNTTKDYIIMVRKNLDDHLFQAFTSALERYKNFSNISDLTNHLDSIFKSNLRYLIPGLATFLKSEHQLEFSTYCQNNGLLDI